MSLLKRSRMRAVGLVAATVALGAFGSIAFTGVSYADAPVGGVNCVASDGGIEGFGSTLARLMQNSVFSAGFTSDVCGAVTPAVATGDSYTAGATTGANMIAYNWKSGTDGETATINSLQTGSGAGLAGADCRAGQFWGTDIPYYQAELTTELNAAPGTAGNDGVNCASALSGLALPFAPSAATQWPASTDGTDQVMTVPIGGSAVTLMINLTKKDCGGTASTQAGTPEFTGQQVSEIMGGQIPNWDSSALAGVSGTAVAANAYLAHCNVPITRVVRADDSGSTNAFKQYAVVVDNSRPGSLAGSNPCNNGTTWQSYIPGASDPGPNTLWPGQTTAGTNEAAVTGGCSALEIPAASGGGAEVNVVDGTVAGVEGTANGTLDGEVGYADLADAKGAPSGTITLAEEQNSTASAFVAPANSAASNCDFSGLTLPGTTPAGNVGLTLSDDWAIDNSAGGNANHSLPETVSGTKWPDCSLTYDLVYVGSNLSGTAAGQSAPVPITASADQSRTLYSYFTYILSSTGQRNLANNYYAPLPNGVLSGLQSGFQQNF
jgi:hypothetical protein